MSKKKIFIFVFIIFILLGLLLFSPIFKIRSVHVIDIGNKNTNFDMSNFDIKENFFLFKTSAQEEKILSSGLVDKVKIEKKFFCKLDIYITWKTPLIAIKSGDSNLILDSQGYVLYITDSDLSLDSIKGIIVKSARIGEPIISEDDSLLENAVNLYLLINENSNLFSSPDIKADLLIKNNDILQIINPNYYINYGDGTNIREKFSKALSIYNDLLEKQVSTGIINVSRKNHYVYETWKE